MSDNSGEPEGGIFVSENLSKRLDDYARMYPPSRFEELKGKLRLFRTDIRDHGVAKAVTMRLPEKLSQFFSGNNKSAPVPVPAELPADIDKIPLEKIPNIGSATNLISPTVLHSLTNSLSMSNTVVPTITPTNATVGIKSR